MGSWTEGPQVWVAIATDARVKNRNLSAVNRWRILISWMKFTWKSHGSGRGIENRKKVSLGQDATWWRIAKNFGTHFWVISANESHTHQKAVKTEVTTKRVRKLQQKVRKIISNAVSALSLFLSFPLSLSLSLSLLTTFYFTLSC